MITLFYQIEVCENIVKILKSLLQELVKLLTNILGVIKCHW